MTCRQFGSRALIALALLSLAVGPSPAAAMATLGAAAAEASSQQDLPADNATGDSPTDDDTPASNDESLSTSYIAPASAKPHETKEAARPLTASSAFLIACIVPPPWRACDQTLLSGHLLSAFDHSPIHPNAPPQA